MSFYQEWRYSDFRARGTINTIVLEKYQRCTTQIFPVTNGQARCGYSAFVCNRWAAIADVERLAQNVMAWE